MKRSAPNDKLVKKKTVEKNKDFNDDMQYLVEWTYDNPEGSNDCDWLNFYDNSIHLEIKLVHKLIIATVSSWLFLWIRGDPMLKEFWLELQFIFRFCSQLRIEFGQENGRL